MPAAPYVFGGSYDSVAGQRFATDQMNIGIQRDDAARRDAALAQQRAEYLAAQQQAAQYEVARQKAAFDFGMGQQTRADNLAANAASAATQGFQFNTQEKRLASQFDATMKDKAADRAANLTFSTKAEADRAASDSWKEVWQAIQNDYVHAPADLEPYNLPPDKKAAALGMLKQRSDEKQAAYAPLAALGVEASKVAYAKMLADSRHKWRWNDAGHKLTESEAYAAVNSQHPSWAKDLQNLKWDVDTQRFTPKIPAPPVFDFGTSKAAAAAPTENSIDFKTPPYGQTSGTGNTGYQFGPQPAPVAPSGRASLVYDPATGKFINKPAPKVYVDRDPNPYGTGYNGFGNMW